MKKFKIGFAAVIALLAMSFTIASREGAFNKKTWNPKRSYTCVNGTDVKAFSWCDGTTLKTVTPSTAFASIPAGACTFSVTRAGANFTCDETQTFFCCFEPNGTCDPSGGTCTTITSGITEGTVHYNKNAQ